MSAPVFARSCRLIEPACDLTSAQRDHLLLILRDRLGAGYITIGHILKVSRKVAETRYLRLRGTTYYRVHTDCGRQCEARKVVHKRTPIRPPTAVLGAVDSPGRGVRILQQTQGVPPDLEAVN